MNGQTTFLYKLCTVMLSGMVIMQNGWAETLSPDILHIGQVNETVPYRLQAEGDLEFKGVLRLRNLYFSQEHRFPADWHWPDYVFHANYRLLPLSKVAAFINDHQHLPDVPSAPLVEEEGLQLGAMQSIQLRKIEELTLYVLQQEEQLDHIEKRTQETLSKF